MHDPALYPHGLVPLPQGVPMDDALRRLGGPALISSKPLTEPLAFVSPQSLTYSLDGEQQRREFISEVNPQDTP